MSADRITVIIADDHLAFGEALQVALDKERDLSVLEIVTDGEAAVRTAVDRHPDVVLMDVQMPGIDGLEATRRIRDGSSDTNVIILTGLDDDLGVAKAVQAGARGYLRKTDAMSDLAGAIRKAHAGEPLHSGGEVREALGRLRRQRAVDGDLARRMDRLTPRELEILQLMAAGITPDAIAARLGMSRHTLRTHTQNVLTKLGVHSKVDAVVAAIRFGKIHTDEIAGPLPSGAETA